MSSGAPVAIVGVGARTPVGLTAPTSAAAVRAGISRIGEHPYMIDKVAEPYCVAMDRSFEEHDRIERLFVLATSALHEALASVPLPVGYELPLFVGMPDQSPWFHETQAQQLGRRLAAHFASTLRPQVVVLPHGNAAGLLALSRACDVVRLGRQPLAAVIGVDSHLDPDALEALDARARLSSAKNRWGYPPGEGAGALLVVPAIQARHQRMPVLATVRTVGIAREPNVIATDMVCVGEGLAEAVKGALSGLPPGEKVASVYCDLNGERYRSSEWVYASLRLPPGLVEDPTAFVAPADSWGDVGAATGPLLASLAIASAQRGYARGRCALVWASSESGLRGVAILDLSP